MNDLSIKRQELCSRLVEREVVYCVSSLMYGVAKLIWNCEVFQDEFGYPDDLIGLYQQDDWETPGLDFIRSDADLDQLEEIAENFGYWSDVLAEIGYEQYLEVKEKCEEVPDDLDDWLTDDDRETIRSKVKDLVDDWAWVGSEYNLDPELREVYEHWIVSNWLARKLDEQGEVTGEFAGLTLWGRTTTGQAIAMDGVIETIAAELWPEEWNGNDNPV